MSSSNSKREQSHISSSSSYSKDRHRSESKKPSTSSSKKDDHYLYREKSSSRQRSRSKDSNDGSANHSGGSRTSLASGNEGSSQLSVNNQSSIKGQSKTDQMKTASITCASQEIQIGMKTICCNPTATVLVTTIEQDISSQEPILAPPLAAAEETEKEFVLPTKPVVVDQILTGNELNLATFIGENRNDPVVSSIERSLSNQVKRPKFADNIHEARKLMKLRKQIERDEQKKLEQARVLAKQYIRTNSTAVNNNSQGVEIEFACVETESGTKMSPPTISSPLKFINGREIDEKTTFPCRGNLLPVMDILGEVLISTKTEIIRDFMPEMNEYRFENEYDEDFIGFDVKSITETSEKLQRFSNFFQMRVNKQSHSNSNKLPVLKKAVIQLLPLDMIYKKRNGQFKETYNLTDLSGTDNRKLFYENNKISDERELLKKQSMIMNRKRKYEISSPNSSHTSDISDVEVSNLTNVLIRQGSGNPNNINASSVSRSKHIIFVYILFCAIFNLLSDFLSFQL